jgi:tellurite resistance protein
MPLSLQTQWTLVASGLIAHSDEVMAGEECELLMALLDERADPDEYTEWFELVSDPDALFSKLEQLEELPEEHHRDVLEEAWLMAAADGKRVPEEADMLGRIARKLGVESVQLDFWREAWTSSQDATAEAGTRVAVHVVAGEETPTKEQRELAQQAWEMLPVIDDRRSDLQKLLPQAQSGEEVHRQLQGLGRPQRKAVLLAVASIVGRADDGARARFEDVARGAGLDDDLVQTLLDQI